MKLTVPAVAALILTCHGVAALGAGTSTTSVKTVTQPVVSNVPPSEAVSVNPQEYQSKYSELTSHRPMESSVSSQRTVGPTEAAPTAPVVSKGSSAPKAKPSSKAKPAGGKKPLVNPNAPNPVERSPWGLKAVLGGLMAVGFCVGAYGFLRRRKKEEEPTKVPAA